jgi:hypothetical protein
VHGQIGHLGRQGHTQNSIESTSEITTSAVGRLTPAIHAQAPTLIRCSPRATTAGARAAAPRDTVHQTEPENRRTSATPGSPPQLRTDPRDLSR